MLKFILQTTVGKKTLASVFKHVQLKNADNHDEFSPAAHFLLAYDRNAACEQALCLGKG